MKAVNIKRKGWLFKKIQNEKTEINWQLFNYSNDEFEKIINDVFPKTNENNVILKSKFRKNFIEFSSVKSQFYKALINAVGKDERDKIFDRFERELGVESKTTTKGLRNAKRHKR